jgi:hypothetical protein
MSDRVCAEIFPEGCELVLPMPNELRVSIDAILKAEPDGEGTKKYPVEHDTRKF